MGKNGRLGKDYGKAAGNRRNDPGYVKKVEAKTRIRDEGENPLDSDAGHVIPLELQQLLLNIFHDAFPAILASDRLKRVLQEVKQALYDRDFGRAFGNDEYLQAYAVRWSPGRSLCYVSILVDLRKHIARLLTTCALHHQRNQKLSQDTTTSAITESSMRVASFGGGAAEVIAVGGFLRYMHDASVSMAVTGAMDDIVQSRDTLSMNTDGSTPKMELFLIDTAQWRDVVVRLHAGLTSPPFLSKYASPSARESNRSLIPADKLVTTFLPNDVLELSQNQLAEMVGSAPMLLTMLFTLNELYTTSISKTTGFLLNLTSVVNPGSLFLVVDSPGSYSETTVGKGSKQYPMQWLLDHTLLETQKAKGTESTPDWEKVRSEDSQWFRLPVELRYSIPLENMRYQIHLYRRL